MNAFDLPLPLRAADTDVLTVGELLIDMIATEYEGEGGGNGYERHFGGSPANIAMNCRHLGLRSRMACCVGQDGMGDFLVRHLEAAGLDGPLVQRCDAATSMVVVTRSKGTPVPIFYRDADFQLAFTPQLEAAVRNARIVHFSCWPISRVPARQTVLRVLDAAREAGALVGFDPNYHPAIWARGEDGIAFVRDIIGRADVVKPSEDDAARLFGPGTPDVQLERFLSLGAKRVVMTMGKEGVLASDGHTTERYAAIDAEVVDTTGAGDAFWSGFYAGSATGLSMREAIRTGLAVSALKLGKVGAVVGLPPLAQVRAQFGL